MTEMRNVSLAEALELIDQGALVLDVRERREWSQGRWGAALNVALSDVPDSLEQLPRERTIVCVCRSGGRSRVAAQFLADHDFDVVNLEGGMLAWVAAGEAIIADHGEPVII